MSATAVKNLLRRAVIAGTTLAVPTLASAATPNPPAWTRPASPIHLVGPIWYVGTEGLASYLIRTRDGAILLDATMAENVPAIERNIRAVGLSLDRVRLLLVSHAHFDHAAGDAAMAHDTGARVIAGVGDVAALESGIPPGETSYGVIRFPAVKVARAVRDGERVTLGGVTLRAIATPGHTPGCTSWSARVVERGRPLTVLFPCSVSVAGNRLIGNRRYPGIVADLRASIARLAREPTNVVLPFHPEQADVRRRAAEHRLVAPALLPALMRTASTDFERELARQAKEAR
ncbi:metallo-beta-lactamase class B [Sphingomonas palmae]|uniref:Metallo-beta-lactamase class B n=1 Tax=Sphingomonas palmae TaxID=1855283 RepID=A0A1H7PVK4_9SPHN|nr:subclass B3 metallo-beta-lactamase [Sphingomonas palmae]SEL39931.1 metallo-beta-lactamase class B [Sphingomonas palmae]